MLETTQKSAQKVSTLSGESGVMTTPSEHPRSTLRGLANVSFFADDLDAGTRLVRRLPRPRAATSSATATSSSASATTTTSSASSTAGTHPAQGGPSGAIAYWHVDDVAATFRRACSTRGATVHDEIRERGHGFVTASVTDPFGNVLGLMSNPNWLDNAR